MTEKKVINEDDARTALVDALADLLHVHGGDVDAVGQEVFEAGPKSVRHYEAEARGEDGIEIEVVRG